MWWIVQAAIYTTLALGCIVLLFLLIRERAGLGRTYHVLHASTRVATVWMVSLGAIAVFSPGPWWAYVWRRTAQIGLVALALLAVEFAAAFVERPAPPRRRLAAAAIVPVVAVLILDSLPAWVPIRVAMGRSLELDKTALGSTILEGEWLVLLGAAWVVSLQAINHARGAEHRNHLNYLLAALVSFAVGDGLILLGGVPDVHVGLSAHLLGLGIAAIATLRHHLPDIRRLLLQSIGVMLVTGVFLGVYAGAVAIAGNLSGKWSALLRLGGIIVPALAAGAFLTVALGPVLQRLLSRWMLGKTDGMQAELRTYSQQTSALLDVGGLADTALDWLESTLHVPRSAFILLAPKEDKRVELRIVRTRNVPRWESRLLSESSHFLLHFARTGQPLRQFDVDRLSWFHDLLEDELCWLRGLGADLYVPILIGEKPAALLALGPKQNGRPYTADEQEVLLILASQTGKVLENAELVDDLRQVQNDLRRLSAQLEETNQHLQRLDQAKSDFVAIAAHELRTPLSQIYGYSDVLATLDTEDQNDIQMMHEFIGGISRGAMRLKRVIDAMLDVSLIDTGTLILQRTPVSVGRAVQKAAEGVRAACEERHVALVVSDLSALPSIDADGHRLEQALAILLHNAVKFTPDGGEIHVSGSVVAGARGEECVQLAVADTGIGIDPDQQALVFDKFYRAESVLFHSSGETRFKAAGPGLGLAIAKGIVEAHGGRIWAESPGRDEVRCPGSTFYIQLPVTGPAQG